MGVLWECSLMAYKTALQYLAECLDPFCSDLQGLVISVFSGETIKCIIHMIKWYHS